ncbi:uroporphyrinogen-III synthase [Aquimarina algicola]|uniref:Uroporphyrinogen-III synthase n=1 Tax=Aquimarina algicola TaxID=2589995 RepID=A0A504JBH3_9FLAO|nr:uroporphyrinogen-III synthase [Aquimarina algicola]TPN87994.1 uroporphyrinogen-III synthase [Aquimarina algicola]
MKPTILSTKKLTIAQKELFLNAGIGVVDFDAITIDLIAFEAKSDIKNVIFTSKNAVKAIQNAKIKIENCFCVGDNTRKLLETNGYNVLETAQNAADLAKIIVENYTKESFTFFCGNIRRDDLPKYLLNNTIAVEEITVYTTHLKAKKIDRSFDGILFFSPSGIQSYTTVNRIDSVAFCIGNTTASEANKHTDQIIIANKPTVENVIVQAVKYFNHNLSSQI